VCCITIATPVRRELRSMSLVVLGGSALERSASNPRLVVPFRSHARTRIIQPKTGIETADLQMSADAEGNCAARRWAVGGRFSERALCAYGLTPHREAELHPRSVRSEALSFATRGSSKRDPTTSVCGRRSGPFRSNPIARCRGEPSPPRRLHW